MVGFYCSLFGCNKVSERTYKQNGRFCSDETICKRCGAYFGGYYYDTIKDWNVDDVVE